MASIHAAVVGIPASTLTSPALRGVGRDLFGWQTRLARMGVAGHRIAVTSGEACTRDDVLQTVRQLSRQLAEDDSATGLLVLSGHGGEHGALLHTADGPLSVQDLADVLDSFLPGRGITALIDVCPVSVPAAQPIALRPCDVVLAASAPGHPAEEIEVDGKWHGAFTWALHQVLDRWASTGPHGALVPVSPALLHHQASLVLQGLGFGQRPTLTGPDAACAAPLGGGERVLRAPLPAMVTRQLDPGPILFTVYDLTHSGGGGDDVVVTGPGFTNTGGYVKNKEYWAVAPQDGDVLKKTSDALPATVPGNAYPQLAFDPGGNTTSYTLDGATLTLLALKNGSDLRGYVVVGGGSPPLLTWYMVPTITRFYPVPAGGLSFSKVTTSVTFSGQKRP